VLESRVKDAESQANEATKRVINQLKYLIDANQNLICICFTDCQTIGSWENDKLREAFARKRFRKI
jgi:hypothetical protein